VEDNVVVQYVFVRVKLTVNRHTLVLEVTNSSWDVLARVFQLLAVSSFSKMHVTGHPVNLMVLVPEESIGLITSGVEEDGTL
jgi:hypothetical protein